MDAFKEFKEKVFKDGKPEPPKREYVIVEGQDLKVRPVDWLWEGHLARGELEILTGEPGVGKSTVQTHYITCVTTTKPWPDGMPSGPPARVIVLTAEDNAETTVGPRLIAAGADLNLVTFLKCIRTDGKGQQFLLQTDLDLLEQLVTDKGDVALITVDPITAYMGGKMNSSSPTEVRSQLAPLAAFAEKMKVAIAAITHPPKNASHKALDWFIGSQSFIAAPRIGHVCVHEVVDEDGSKTRTGRIFFATAKHTLSADDEVPTLAYHIETVFLPTPNNPWKQIKTSHVVWDKDPVDISPNEAVQAASSKGESKARGKQAEVQQFLRELLEAGEPVAANHIFEEGAKHGFSERQFHTAKGNLYKLGFRITVEKEGESWLWQHIPFSG
jgi:putative DNA primase/helicase